MRKKTGKKIGYGLLLGILCTTFFHMQFQWQELNRFSNQAGLRYEEGGLSARQMEEYAAKEAEDAEETNLTAGQNGIEELSDAEERAEITAWSMEKGQQIEWEDTGRQVEGTILKVYGNMARVLPFSMKSGGYTFNGDADGCVISSGLAWKLFGAEAVTGNVVSYDGKEWQIRGVFDREESVLALYQQDQRETMSYVELWSENDAPASKLAQIKSSLGLFGESYVFAGSFYCSIARILLSLPFWLMFFYLCKEFGKRIRKMEQRRKGWMRAAGSIFLLIIFIAGIYHTISFTADFIPVQWSDFGFWTEKGEEIIAGIRQRKQFPEIYWEEQVLVSVRKIAVDAVVMMFGISYGRRILQRKKHKSEVFILQ